MRRSLALAVVSVATSAWAAVPMPVFPDGLHAGPDGALKAMAQGPTTFSSGAVDVVLPATVKAVAFEIPVHGAVLTVQQNDAATLYPVAGGGELAARAAEGLAPANPPESVRYLLLSVTAAIALIGTLLWLARPPRWGRGVGGVTGGAVLVGVLAMWAMLPTATVSLQGNEVRVTAWKTGTFILPADRLSRLTGFTSGVAHPRLELRADGTRDQWVLRLRRGDEVVLRAAN